MNINLPSKKHLAVAVVITVLVAGAVSAAVWKYKNTDHGPTYAQLQSENTKLKQQVSTLQKENATTKDSLTQTNNKNQKLTSDKTALCTQVIRAKLPSLVCTN